MGIGECFEEAKGQVGLDQYEVRRGTAGTGTSPWPMLAHAYLSVTQHQAMEQGERWAVTPGRTADSHDSAGGAPPAHRLVWTETQPT